MLQGVVFFQGWVNAGDRASTLTLSRGISLEEGPGWCCISLWLACYWVYSLSPLQVGSMTLHAVLLGAGAGVIQAIFYSRFRSVHIYLYHNQAPAFLSSCPGGMRYAQLLKLVSVKKLLLECFIQL